MISAQQEQALQLIGHMEKREAEYDKLNKALRAVQGDFCCHVDYIDDATSTEVFNLLDSILGDEIASYYFFEARHMKGGGKIVLSCGQEYSIATLDDVRKYVGRQ